jgi:hypothetical protein
MRYCLPHKEVREVLFGCYLPLLKKDRIEYKLGFAVDPKIKLNKALSVELRCVKFNHKNRYEFSWPDNAAVYLGRNKLCDFRPLQTSSPLKRRQDEPIKLEKGRLQAEN